MQTPAVSLVSTRELAIGQPNHSSASAAASSILSNEQGSRRISGGLLAEQDFTALLKASLSPIITTAILNMVLQRTHTPAPHLRLLWLAQRYQSHAQEMLTGTRSASATSSAHQLEASSTMRAAKALPQQLQHVSNSDVHQPQPLSSNVCTSAPAYDNNICILASASKTMTAAKTQPQQQQHSPRRQHALRQL